ncbi:alpha/beta fold hydrolase [Mesorhizobium sp. ANAO-SY3R2]|uniref:alpha/beta fold hydrolase n=1 Tax=Mesorhizobium sp. ANAO-SY3R2 TaxID=3166644 RepID=UPI003670B083
MPFDGPQFLQSPTGATLSLYVRRTDAPARAVVQVNHGLAEHAARYGRFADFLASHGYHVYAHDHRGHGATSAPDAPVGRFAAKDGVERVLDDVLAVHDHIAEEHPGVPVVIFGHSLGGLIALDFVLRHPDRIAAVAIWNANFSAGPLGRLAQLILAFERFRLGSDVPSRMLPKLTFSDWAKKIPDRRTEFDWLSRNPSEVDAYVADPLCGWDASVSMWIDIFQLVFTGADDGSFAQVRKDLPFNLVGGEHDPATSGGKAVEQLGARLRRMGFSNLVSTVYPETRHESLNEINRDVVMADFAGWLDGVLPK